MIPVLSMALRAAQRPPPAAPGMHRVDQHHLPERGGERADRHVVEEARAQHHGGVAARQIRHRGLHRILRRCEVGRPGGAAAPGARGEPYAVAGMAEAPRRERRRLDEPVQEVEEH